MFRGDDSQSVIYLQAAKLFMQFQRFVLKEQMRAAEDPVHCTQIERFSLKNKNPPITQDITNNFHCLTPELIKEDPSFKNAAIAVQSNEERSQFGKLKAIQFGMEHKEPIFYWVLNIQTDVRGGDKKRAEQWVDVGAIELEYYFVRGMPMVICCNGKIGHEDWQIANGRKCIAHSFFHAEQDDFNMTTDVWNPSSAGKIIKIDQPEILNVQLLKNDKTLGEVIPFKRKASKKPMIAFLKHASPQTRKIFNETSLIPSVLAHDVEQGFCFTYNKLQGATIDRLIIVLFDLSNCKL